MSVGLPSTFSLTQEKNDFLHFAFLGNFGGGEIILIFLVPLFLAIPVAIVLLVVFLLNKNKSPGPAPQAPRPLHPVAPQSNFCSHCGTALTDPPANYCPHCGKPL